MPKKQSQIKVVKIKENKDGSANIDIQMSDDIYNFFFRQGIWLSLPKNKRKNFVVVPFEKNMALKNTRKIELTDKESDMFVEIGVIEAIKEMIKKEKV